MTDIVKLYDINKTKRKITNSYDYPTESLSFILNNYKSKLNIQNVFTSPIRQPFNNYLFDYSNINTNTKIVKSYYDDDYYCLLI